MQQIVGLVGHLTINTAAEALCIADLADLSCTDTRVTSAYDSTSTVPFAASAEMLSADCSTVKLAYQPVDELASNVQNASVGPWLPR